MIGHNIRVNRGAVLVLSLVVFIALIYVYNGSSEEKPIYGMLRNTNQINLRKVLIGTIKAAQRGGLEIVEVSKSQNLNQKSKGKTKEGADDPVTDADARSHCVMKSGLHRIFPKLTIVSEEDKGLGDCMDGPYFDLDPTVLHEAANVPDEVVNVRDVTVWIDPLDATQEFTEQLFKYVTTMVCVAVKGVPTIGVIHSPFSDKTTWSWLGKAVSEDLMSIKKDDTLPRNPIITVSRSHAGDVKEISKNVFGEKANIHIDAGAGFKVLQVVFNNASAYLHTTRIKKWDICAGNAILNSLGGKMTNLFNEEINYSSTGSPVNDKGLLATLNNHDLYINKLMAFKAAEGVH